MQERETAMQKIHVLCGFFWRNQVKFYYIANCLLSALVDNGNTLAEKRSQPRFSLMSFA
jgi:hypothetical protein